MFKLTTISGLLVVVALSACSPFLHSDFAILTESPNLPLTSEVIPHPPPPLPPVYRGWDTAIGYSSASAPEKRLRQAVINGLNNYIEQTSGKYIILRSSVQETTEADLENATEKIRSIDILESETDRKHILQYRVVTAKDEQTVEGMITWVQLAIQSGEASKVIGGSSSIERNMRNSARIKISNVTDAITFNLNRPPKKSKLALIELFKLIDIPTPSISDGEPVEYIGDLVFGDALFNKSDELLGIYLGHGLFYDGTQVRQINRDPLTGLFMREIYAARRLEELFVKLDYHSVPTEWLERQLKSLPSGGVAVKEGSYNQ
jgi:hypothetical protein